MNQKTFLKPDKDRTTILRILYLTGFIVMLGIGIITPVLPVYAHIMGATGFWVGVIFSAFTLSRTLCMPYFGKKSDHYGRRIFILVGLAGYSLFSYLYIFADSVLSLTIIRFIHGVFSAMVFPITVAYVADMTIQGEEGESMGKFQSFAFLGMSCGPLLGGVLVEQFNSDSAFLSLAGLSVLAFILCLFFLPDYKIPAKSSKPILSLLFHPSLKVPVIGFLLYSAVFSVFVVFLPLLGHSIQLDYSDISLLIFGASITMVICQRFSGKFIDIFNKYWTIAIGAGMMSAALLLFPFTGNLLHLLGYSILLGCGLGLTLTSFSAMMVIEGRKHGQGSVEGILNTAQGIGIIISPVLFGLVLDHSNITLVFILGSMISVIMTVWMAVLYQKSLHNKEPYDG